jgi:hypothetical protein
MKLDLPLDAMLFDRSEQHEAFLRIGIEKTSSKIPFLFIISLTHDNGCSTKFGKCCQNQ